eukprot:gene2178-34389_t
MLRLQLHHVYILEAHPVDGWVDADNVSEGICLRQAKTFEQRVAAAEALASAAGLARDSILVDGMDNAAELGFEARPEKLVLVENGNSGGSGAGGGEVTNKILFLSGIGPYQYSPKKLATYLEGLRK